MTHLPRQDFSAFHREPWWVYPEQPIADFIKDAASRAGWTVTVNTPHPSGPDIGTEDLTLRRGGVTKHAEIKAHDGKQSTEQKAHQAAHNAAGEESVVVGSHHDHDIDPGLYAEQLFDGPPHKPQPRPESKNGLTYRGRLNIEYDPTTLTLTYKPDIDADQITEALRWAVVTTGEDKDPGDTPCTTRGVYLLMQKLGVLPEGETHRMTTQRLRRVTRQKPGTRALSISAGPYYQQVYYANVEWTAAARLSPELVEVMAEVRRDSAERYSRERERVRKKLRQRPQQERRRAKAQQVEAFDEWVLQTFEPWPDEQPPVLRPDVAAMAAAAGALPPYGYRWQAARVRKLLGLRPAVAPGDYGVNQWYTHCRGKKVQVGMIPGVRWADENMRVMMADKNRPDYDRIDQWLTEHPKHDSLRCSAEDVYLAMTADAVFMADIKRLSPHFVGRAVNDRWRTLPPYQQRMAF